MPKFDGANLKKVSVSLPFGIGSAEWEVDPTERRAAWSLYVELVTRIAVQPLTINKGLLCGDNVPENTTLELVEPLANNEGLLREALNSLYSLFGTTREILKQAGPDVGASHDSVGGIAIAVLNNGLRPVLSKWHPLLQTWESQRPPHLSAKAHEANWSFEPALREGLELLRKDLEKYADALAEIVAVKE